MAKKKAKKPRRKSAERYGVVYLDQIEPAIPVEGRNPVCLSMTIDEGLKLHLALLQALSDLNRLDRRSPASRARGIKLAVFPSQNRMMIEQGNVKDNSAPR